MTNLYFFYSPWRRVITLKAAITTAADDKFCDIFPNFPKKNKVWYFIRIVCQQTIIMKYHALFVIFEKATKFENCRLLQIIGGALRVKEKKVNHKKEIPFLL